MMDNTQSDYDSLRASLSVSTAMTLLQIGDESTSVVTSGVDNAVVTQPLTVGASHIARTYFKHNPPTPDEMETAIMVVEDEVIRISPAVNRTSQLLTTESNLADIAQLAGLPLQAQTIMSLESVERMFDRLAAVMMGRPAASEGIPADNVFAARLLILREFMHHLQFSSITYIALPKPRLHK